MSTLPSESNRFPFWQVVSVIFCVSFGVTLMLNMQPMGDGMWFWYGAAVRQGKLLYANMHLALQPLYVLETAFFQRVLGIGWIATHIPAFIHLIFFVPTLWLIARRYKWTDIQTAILLLCVFLESIYFNAYRFDDYHVVADLFQALAILSLFQIYDSASSRKILALAGFIGIICGFSTTTRINDGGALLITSMAAMLLIVKKPKLASIFVCLVAAVLTVIVVVLLTGDTLRDYVTNSILRAAASKGGGGSLLRAPLLLPIQTIKDLLGNWRIAMSLSWAVVIVFLTGWASRKPPGEINSKARSKRVWITVGVIAITLPVLARQLWFGGVTLGLSGVIAFLGIIACPVVVFRGLKALSGSPYEHWSPLEMLLLIPAAQMAGSSMSSGGTFMGAYSSIAMMFLLIPAVISLPAQTRWARVPYLAFGVLMTFCIIPTKIQIPFDWHTYNEPPMFTDRTWYQHPVYGSMYVSRPNLRLERSICEHVASTPSPTLLSLPYPYANYFCAIAPWHDSVQTFFDTSGKQAIDAVVDGLNTDPPKWIVYQRQLEILRKHEIRYNHGNRLPHRDLDDLLMKKIESGTWHVALHESWPRGAEWYLIRTDVP